MSSLLQEAKELFEPRSELHRLRISAAKILNKDEWDAYKKVSNKFEKERSAARQTFKQEYDSRVSQSSQRLINKAAAVKRRLVPRALGNDGFNKDHIRRQAQLEVRAAHKAEIAQIDKRESSATRSFLDKAQERGPQREKLIQDFQKATDRRVRSWSR